MSILSSKLLYCFILFIALLCAYISCRFSKKRWIVVGMLGIIVFIFTYIAGFRGETVGIDTEAYKRVFMILETGYKPNIEGVADPGFLLISRWVVLLTKSTQAPFVFWSFVTNLFIILRLYGVRGRISFPFAIFVYYVSFYFLTFNLLRQFVAIGIIFYATKWMEQGRLVKYCIVVALAATIHFSAILSLVVVPISLLYSNKTISKWKKVFLWMFFIILPGGAVVVVNAFLSRYDMYSTVATGGLENIGFVMPFKIAVFAVFMMVSKVKVTIGGELLLKPNYKDNNRDIYKIEDRIYLIGLFGYFMSYFIRYFDRVALYFTIFELVCYSRYYNRSKNIFLNCLLIFTSAISFVLMLLGTQGGQGELPYSFCW